MKKDIFISHSSKDFGIAEKICKILENNNLKCWIAPRDVRPGYDYDEEIIDGIEKTEFFILLLSANSNISQHVKRELEIAQGKHIFPLRIQNVEPSIKLKYFLSPIHWIDVIDPPFESKINPIIEIIKSIQDKNIVKDENEKAARLISESSKKNRIIKTTSKILIFLIIVVLLFVLNQKFDFFQIKKVAKEDDIQIVENSEQSQGISQQIVLDTEIDFFLNREVYFKGKIMRFEQFINIALDKLKEEGLNVQGPNCLKRYDNYLIRYKIDGQDKDSKLWDTNIDFEVNSQTQYFKPISELAIQYNKILDKDSQGSNEKNINPNVNTKKDSHDLNTELDFFLNREVTFQSKLFRYEQLVEMFIEKLKDNGLMVEGPVCRLRNNNYLVRYTVTGTDKNGKIWDTNMDFEVNSKEKYFEAVSTLATTLNNLVDPDYR